MLQVKDLIIEFEGAQHNSATRKRVVHGVSFEVKQNSVTVLMGESGAGKTVTALSILKLLPLNSSVQGSITFLGRELLTMNEKELRSIRGSQIVMAFQDSLAAFNPVLTIGEQLRESANGTISLEESREALRSMELEDPDRCLSSYPYELSGGMRQRAFLAMALLAKPKLLIADEPTSSLDVIVKQQILDLLLKIRKKVGLSILLVTHDFDVMSKIACEEFDEVILVRDGQIEEKNNAFGILSEPYSSYARTLLKIRKSLLNRDSKLETGIEEGAHV